MTEEKAKTKWCPFVRVIIAGGDGFIGPANRAVGTDGVEGRQGSRCIGSECMAWRERRDIATSAETGVSRSVILGGYCGLAGAPQ